MNELLEKLAALEHEQWMQWSKSVAERNLVGRDCMDRWLSLWKPYDKLTEAEKELDRMWARRVLSIIGHPRTTGAKDDDDET